MRLLPLACGKPVPTRAPVAMHAKSPTASSPLQEVVRRRRGCPNVSLTLAGDHPRRNLATPSWTKPTVRRDRTNIHFTRSNCGNILLCLCRTILFHRERPAQSRCGRARYDIRAMVSAYFPVPRHPKIQEICWGKVQRRYL